MSKRKIYFDQPSLPFEEFKEPQYVQRRCAYPLMESADNESEAQQPDQSDRILNYISFGSGSSGNSCFIGTKKCGVIIDAGVKHDFIEKKLSENGIPVKSVSALLLTHDHSDHVRYAYTLLRNHKHIGLYCTPRVLNGILRRHNISKRIKDFHNPIFKEIPFKIGALEITAFEVPHDGSDNMGFSLSFDNRNFVLATDLGAVTERARHYMSQANYLVIESNYDLQMLLHGVYPEHLKARIQTQFGHLDNMQTAEFLSQIISPRLKHIFLCHLSADNNTPDKALKASFNALSATGITVGSGENTIEDRKAPVQLTVLPRFEATRLYAWRPEIES